MPLTSNTAGNMYALTVLSPVVPERLEELRSVLAALPQRPSPLARLTATHFARFVIVPDFVNDPSQPDEDHLPSPYLLFSATLDGTLDRYLEELSEKLADEAEAIWGCCVGAPRPARGTPLQAYLRHNQVQTGLFFAAYPDASVAHVRGALSLREQTIAFAVRGQGMAPEALQQAFLEEF